MIQTGVWHFDSMDITEEEVEEREEEEACLIRLNEMRVLLEKIRPTSSWKVSFMR